MSRLRNTAEINVTCCRTNQQDIRICLRCISLLLIIKLLVCWPSYHLETDGYVVDYVSHSLKTSVKTPSHSVNRNEKSKNIPQSQFKCNSGNSDLWPWGKIIVVCCSVAKKVQCCHFWSTHCQRILSFSYINLKRVFYHFSDGAVRWRHCIPLQHTCSSGYNGVCGLFHFWWVKFIEIQTICPFLFLIRK